LDFSAKFQEKWNLRLKESGKTPFELLVQSEFSAGNHRVVVNLPQIQNFKV